MSAPSVHRALSLLVASGIRPPWAGADPDCSRADVTSLWTTEAARRRVEGEAIVAASRAWLAEPATGTRWWPPPGDVLAHAARATFTGGDGCGRCNETGMILVAVHRAGRVERWYAHCDCSRGAAWADKRAQPGKEGAPPGQRPPQARAFAATMRARADVEAAYVDPTDAQRYPGCRVPALSADAEARLRATLDDIRAARGHPPHPARDWREDEGRW